MIHGLTVTAVGLVAAVSTYALELLAARHEPNYGKPSLPLSVTMAMIAALAAHDLLR